MAPPSPAREGLTPSVTHLRARVGDEALEGDGLAGRREGRLSEALHEGVDDCQGDLVPLFHLVQDLQGKGSWEARLKGSRREAPPYEPSATTIPPTPPQPWSSQSLRTFQAPLPAASLSSLNCLPPRSYPRVNHHPRWYHVPVMLDAVGASEPGPLGGHAAPRLPLESPQGLGQTPSLRALCRGTLLQAKAKG